MILFISLWLHTVTDHGMSTSKWKWCTIPQKKQSLKQPKHQTQKWLLNIAVELKCKIALAI